MHFVFYPNHEFGCPHVKRCPHLGGAALGTLVFAADQQTEWTDALHRQIDALRAENSAKYEKIEELTARVEQLERELKAERQKQFKSKKEEPSPEEPPEGARARRNAERRWAIRAGIASGPTSFDQLIAVAAPASMPALRRSGQSPARSPGLRPSPGRLDRRQTRGGLLSS